MDQVLKRDTRFWAIDKLVLAYFGFMAVLIVYWWTGIPGAPVLLAWHAAGAALLVFEVKRPNPTSWFFRNWYAGPYTAACFREMSVLIPLARNYSADQLLSDLDFRIWHVHPTVWLERIYSPALTEFLQWVYMLFIPAAFSIAVILWVKGKYPEFQYYSFLMVLGFLLSYIGYVILPARGPRFLLKHLEHAPLQGMWMFGSLQTTLDQLESKAYDCFPSGHTELTILACWGSRMISKRAFYVYFAYTPCLIFATVYLRYHYTVDVFAGAILAFILIAATPSIYRKLHHGV